MVLDISVTRSNRGKREGSELTPSPGLLRSGLCSS